MRSFPLITLILLAALSGRTQDTTWYDAFNKVTIRQRANTYRVRTHTDSGWRVNHYYRSGQMSSTCLYADDSLRIAKEAKSFYNSEGILTCRRNYKDGKPDGKETYYHDNGKVWAAGNNLNGQSDGEWRSWHPSGALAGIAQFSAGKQVSAQFFNEDGSSNDKVDSFFRTAAYPGGNLALRSYLQKRVRYPDPSRRSGIEGIVVVEFRVSKEGKLIDMAVAKSVAVELDKEACRVLKGLDDWTPALIGGLPALTYFKLPISFKLAN